MSIRSGIRSGLVSGLQSGLNPGFVPDLFVLVWGQSTDGYGFTTYLAAGTSPTTGAPLGRSAGDPGLAFDTPFPACRFNQDSSDTLTNPMAYAVHTGTEDLQPYAGAGVPNVGMTQSLGRMLVRNGIAKAPYIAVCAVAGSSVPGNWLPGVFPASGEKMYSHLRDFGLARMSETGRRIDLLVVGIGSTDAGTPARVTSMPTDMAAMLSALRTDWSLPSLPVFMAMVHTDTAAPADATGYRAQQVAFQPTDVDCTLYDVSPYIPLENSFLHFLSGGCADQGDLVATLIRDRFRPGLNLDLQSGPAPWYQGGAAGYTAQSGTGGLLTTARPRGYVEPKVGDIEILMAHNATVVATVTLPTAAGFTALTAQVDSSVSTARRGITTWSRTIDATLLAARTAQPDGTKKGPCATPAVDFGAGVLNFATIHCVRGAAGIETTQTGTVAANSATVTVPGFTTLHDNCLVMILVNSSNTSGQVISISNPAFVGLKLGRNTHQINPGSGGINSEMWYATIPVAGTVVGSTVITFGISSIIGVAAIIVFNP